MKRDIGALTGERFDLLVIGGGVHGAFATWDATLRGLRVALIERGDFACATSSNSLKIAHGGFRHLRNGDLGSLRVSLDEQIALQRIAPHLVRPLRCVMQSGHRLARSSALMSAALGLHREVARRRAEQAGTERSPDMDAAGIVKGSELAEMLAPLEPKWRSGAVWMDAIIESPERLVIGVLRAAVDAGAVVASYVEARSVIPGERGIRVEAVGEEEGQFTIDARLVLDARGPWSGRALVRGVGGASAVRKDGVPSDRTMQGDGASDAATSPLPLARACNIVVRGPAPRAAVALPHPSEPRMLFAVPWRDRLMLGTSYEPAPSSRHPGDGMEVDALVRMFDAALPGVSLERSDVEYVHSGLLPASRADGGMVRLRGRPQIVDFRERHGVEGIVSMVGVKWTTARAVAELAVDLCQRKLGLPVRRGGTDRTAIAGGGGDDDGRASGVDGGVASGVASGRASGVASRVEGRAEGCAEGRDFDRALYGTLAREVDAIARDDPSLALPLAPGSHVIGAQVAHAVRQEMARHLDDVVLRRSELGTAGMPSEAELGAAAAIAGAELGWSDSRAADELARVRAVYWWRCG